MKNALYLLLSILILGNLSHFGLPWWMLVLIAALAGGLFPTTAGKTFSAAFAGGLLLWCLNAYLLDTANAGALSAKVGQLFQGLKSWQLLSATGFMGGILAGMGALTGLFARDAFVGRAPKR